MSALESSEPTVAGSPALKEWAVVCTSLLEGEQIITIRKGGIHEDGRHFSLPHQKFFLFPTYEHQSAELLKPAYRDGVARTQSEAAIRRLMVPGWCEVTDIIKVDDIDDIEKFDSKHIWTTGYVTDRLKWKKRDPLWVLIVRAHRLTEPVDLPLSGAYGGCKSWVDLDAAIDFDGVASLSDTAFEAKRRGIRDVLS